MTANRDNVAVFNPLVLALPNWHPDGPDGDVDGFAIPFVMPPASLGGEQSRDARILVKPDSGGRGWTAVTHKVPGGGYGAHTAEQARALAGAWIRAAEILDNVTKRAAEPAADEDQDQPEPPADPPFAEGHRVRVSDRTSKHHDRFGTVKRVDFHIEADTVDVLVDLETNRGRPAISRTFRPDNLELITR